MVEPGLKTEARRRPWLVPAGPRLCRIGLACLALTTVVGGSSQQWGTGSTAASALSSGEKPVGRSSPSSPFLDDRRDPGDTTYDDVESEATTPPVSRYTHRSNTTPPPPPPEAQYSSSRPPFESTRTPIHYQFQTRSPEGRQKKPNFVERDDLPQTYSDLIKDNFDDNVDSNYASPRNDAIGRYMSTSRGKALLLLSSGTVGGAIGAFLGKSLLNRPFALSIPFFFTFWIAANLRNSYGEFVKALGMTLIFAVQRSRRIRKTYPTFCHVKALIGAAQRREFPPIENPWAYVPLEEGDVEFKMLYSVIAMGFVGSACGGNLPLIPAWIGALAGAGSFAFWTTARNAQGDLARTIGMRVVSLAQEILQINYELELLSKFGVVSGKVLDKLLILDRKHRIKDRLVAGTSWAYDRISRTAAEVQNDMQSPSRGGDERFSGNRRPRDGDDRFDRRDPAQGREWSQGMRRRPPTEEREEQPYGDSRARRYDPHDGRGR